MVYMGGGGPESECSSRRLYETFARAEKKSLVHLQFIHRARPQPSLNLTTLPDPARIV